MNDLRRRRSASRRMPCLSDGRRDPLDPPRDRTITVRAVAVSTVEFVGNDHVIHNAIRMIGVRRFERQAGGGAWLIETSVADDVIAYLEARSYRIEVTL